MTDKEKEIAQLKKLDKMIEDNFGYSYSINGTNMGGVKYLPSIKRIKRSVERLIKETKDE